MFKRKLSLLLTVAITTILLACGGDDPTPLVATADTTVQANANTTGAVAGTPISFPNGVAAFGTTGATTLVFTDSTTPGFTISSGGFTASGTTEFGSCIFKVGASTFPAGSPLEAGQTVIVNPCTMTVKTKGKEANGATQTSTLVVVLGTTTSAPITVTFSISASGQITVNSRSFGTVTLTPITGVTGTTS